MQGLACAAGALAVSPLLASCKARASYGTPANITLVLDYTPNTNHIGIYVALAKGYYEDAGINLNIEQPPEDGADALVGFGNVEFGISFQDWMANYLGSKTPLPVTAVAAILQHNTAGIMSLREADITSAAMMQNKRYGSQDNACDQAIVKAIMIHDGIIHPELTMLNASGLDELSALQANLFDCIEVFAGWGLQNAYIQDILVNFFYLRDQVSVFDFYTPVIIANNSFLEQEADLVRAFLKATAQGYQDAARDPLKATQLLVEQVPELAGELTERSAIYLADYFLTQDKRWGVFSAERWSRFYSWMNDENLTRVPLVPDKGFSNAYLS